MDIAFAVDGLYSAGWWPSDGESCVQSADGRWYPDEAASTEAFARAGWRVQFMASRCGSAVRAVWRAPSGGRGVIVAGDPISARILVHTALVRSQNIPTRVVVDPP